MSRSPAYAALVIVLVVASTPPVRSEDAERRAQPVQLDAGWMMEEILATVERVDARVLSVDVGRKQARFQVEVEDPAALDAVCSALEGSTVLRETGRRPGLLLEMPSTESAKARWRQEFVLTFRQGREPGTPEQAAASVSMKQMRACAAQAGLQIAYAWAERAHVDPRTGVQTVAQRFRFQRATRTDGGSMVEKLQRLFLLVRQTKSHWVTGVQWSREPTADGGDVRGGQLLQARVEVTVWAPLASGSMPVPSPGALAQSILGGSPADLTEAAAFLDAYSLEARVLLLREIRGQARVRGILANRRVKGVRLDAAGLEGALQGVLGSVDVPWSLSERVRTELAREVRVTVDLDDLSLLKALEALTMPYGMDFVVRNETVFVFAHAEGEPILWSDR